MGLSPIKNTFAAGLLASRRIRASARAAVLLALLVPPPAPSQVAHPRIAAVAENTAIDLGPYRCDAPEDDPSGCERITDYSTFKYDRSRHRMLMFGGGHATTMRDDVNEFDLARLTWRSAYPATPCAQMRAEANPTPLGTWAATGHPVSRHSYDLLVFTEPEFELILLPGVFSSGAGFCVPRSRWKPLRGNRVHHYDPRAKRWRASEAQAFRGEPAAEFDPISGLVVVLGHAPAGGVWLYDPVGETRRQILSSLPPGIGYANNLVYFPPNGRMYYFARGNPTRVFEVTLDRAAWSRSTVSEMPGLGGEPPGGKETGYAFDSVNGIIGGAIRDGVFFAFDPIERRWASRTIVPASPAGSAVGTVAFHALDFDPVDNLYVFITDRASGRRTWAYRYRARR